VEQPTIALEQVFWHPTFDTQKMTKLRKNDEISAQTYHSDDFFDLKFSFSPCWRMCCPAGSLSAGDPLPRLEPRVATHASACVYNIYIYIVWYIHVETRLKDGLFYFHAISSVKKCPLAWTWDHDDDDHLLACLIALGIWQQRFSFSWGHHLSRYFFSRVWH